MHDVDSDDDFDLRKRPLPKKRVVVNVKQASPSKSKDSKRFCSEQVKSPKVTKSPQKTPSNTGSQHIPSSIHQMTSSSPSLSSKCPTQVPLTALSTRDLSSHTIKSPSVDRSEQSGELRDSSAVQHSVKFICQQTDNKQLQCDIMNTPTKNRLAKTEKNISLKNSRSEEGLCKNSNELCTNESNSGSSSATTPKKETNYGLVFPKRQTSITSFFKSTGTSPKETLPAGQVKKELEQKIPLTEVKPVASVEKQTWFPKYSTNTEKGKFCPPHKKLPDLPIAIDAFNYGSIPGVSAYFLSHFHYDHYIGLTKSFKHKIYCDQVTANLVMHKLRINESQIFVLSREEPQMVCGVEVILMDAFHCPGAVMFIFKYCDGRVILHTGDFRAQPSMETHPCLKNIYVDILYLDTTYLEPQYDFPSQDLAVSSVIKIASKHIKEEPKTLFVCGTYSVGKEKVFLGIAESLGLLFSATESKVRILECLEDETVNMYLTKDWNKAQIHVMSMGDIGPRKLHQHLSNFKHRYNTLVAFKPTGWEFSKSTSGDLTKLVPRKFGSVIIYGVPYSEHSSYSELRRFVQWLKPGAIVPTVNMESSDSRMAQQTVLSGWLDEVRNK